MACRRTGDKPLPEPVMGEFIINACLGINEFITGWDAPDLNHKVIYSHLYPWCPL